jgi:two-component system chemotaxis sensor kinase CheA
MLVTDVDMPEMDGFRWRRRCAASRAWRHPIIALSSSLTPESIERGRKVGFHDYVAKFDRQSLIAALKEQTADIIQAA